MCKNLRQVHVHLRERTCFKFLQILLLGPFYYFLQTSSTRYNSEGLQCINCRVSVCRQ